jgi:hypothetical protein
MQLTLFVRALASPTSTRNKVVDVGGQGFRGAPKDFQPRAFLRRVVTARVGDSVAFRLKSGLIHNATPGRSGSDAQRHRQFGERPVRTAVIRTGTLLDVTGR